MDKNVYLKPSVIVEPLILYWYEWSYLIPPITAGCNILERHIRIMESYIQNPEIHKRAIEDPTMLGGPFINLNGKKVDDIKELLKKTQKEASKLIELAESYKKLELILQERAQGDSLESFYQEIPRPLKGMVELVYDVNHHPSVRLIEPLVYRKYYSNTNQGIALTLANKDFRKFLLSTPRIDEELYIQIPFSDSRLDELFLSKNHPSSFLRLKSLFQIPDKKLSLFASLFTEKLPKLAEDREFKGPGVRIRYFGHACVLVQTPERSILFDPVISYDYHSDIARYTFSDLPDKIDYVIITHNHQDHLMFETLLQLRYKIDRIVVPRTNNGFIADPNIKLILKNIGFKRITEIVELESISIPDGEIIGIPFLGEHSDLNIHSKLSYCIRYASKKFLFAADSNNLDPYLYHNLFQVLGRIDVIFLGMECKGAPLTWLYGPVLPNGIKRSYDNNRTLAGSDCAKAIQIVSDLGCKEAYVYAMGQEPWLNYIMALDYNPESPQIIESNNFINACNSKGIKSRRPFGQDEWLYK
jgi:L-ascorbate metabolism protein UlaG (beta-lactamase superfamily)